METEERHHHHHHRDGSEQRSSGHKEHYTVAEQDTIVIRDHRLGEES